MVERHPEMKLNNPTVLASTGKRPVEIERPFLSPRGLSLDGCDVRLVDPRELRGCRREHGFHWERRDTVPRKVQGQLEGVDQEVCLQLIYESGQRPEDQITALGLVSRQEVESREQVTESFNIPEGFPIVWYWTPNR